ncbi:ABC transporter permease subunit [Shewanella sp. 10N.286.52.B9]|uniref:ABC transporter permease n=1 Tax=Shewanella sp. 10N.286.52.B9 TaxID=1880837 RepID=UPI000C85631F|nr:ABC transporter permease subunit [Shewanella sp. 10N.286.52.B9]
MMFTPILTIASKEIKDNFRNRWVVFIGLILTSLSLIISFSGSVVTGELAVPVLPMLMASLSSIGVFILPLTAILLSYDSFIGEEESGTLLLLLSYPLSRSQILLGKFVGHITVLACTIVFSFGLTAALIHVFTGTELSLLLPLFCHLVFSSILLSMCFVLVGYVVSLQVAEKAKAIAILLFIWVAVVLVYDLILLTLMVAETVELSSQLLQVMILLNPSDIFRALMLVAAPQQDTSSSLSSLVQFPLSNLYIALTIWVGVMMLISQSLFHRKIF